MALIKNIDEIRRLIPTYKDLARCGNFASVEKETIAEFPIYAFVVDGSNSVMIKHYRVKFLLLGLTNLYSLILTNLTGHIGRYCDFVAIPRDVTKKIRIEEWKWSEDAIGLSLRSDNANRNFVYFGTEESDEDIISKYLKKGYRNETTYPKLDDELKKIVLDSLKNGRPSSIVIEEKKEKNIDEKLKEKGIEIIPPSPPMVSPVDFSKRLPATANIKKPRESLVNYEEVLKRYSRMLYGRDDKKETIITTETVYV